ncbi:hypothetical protein CCACVL1_11002 [Corchorus capsularis]|uniref:Uncharacterized protein n=1 Tax=Corchorus capsularis TaxID=210143 RepID=A0A1R3IND9_COCAP|nr:hypothetical protein CCACVL1_11002 [Corchorus capsularis]
MMYQHQAKKKPHDGSRTYSFDVSKTNEVFDFLLKSGIIKLPPEHVLPSSDDVKGREYGKYHDSWRHSTKNCTMFRNIVQEMIEKGILKFLELPKKYIRVDKNPFVAPVHMVALNLLKDGQLTSKDARKKEMTPKGAKSATTSSLKGDFQQEDKVHRHSSRRNGDEVESKPLGSHLSWLLSLTMATMRLKAPRRKLEYYLTDNEEKYLMASRSSAKKKQVQRKLDFSSHTPLQKEEKAIETCLKLGGQTKCLSSISQAKQDGNWRIIHNGVPLV